MRGSALVIVLAVIVGLGLLAGGHWVLQQWKTAKDDAVQTWQKISDDARRGMDSPPATQPAYVPPATVQVAIEAVVKRGGEVVGGTEVPHRVMITLPPGRGIVDADLGMLKPFRKMRVRLVLARTGITDAGLKRLPETGVIDALNLSQTPITDAGLAHLRALDELTELDLSKTGVTDSGMRHVKAVEHLMQLDLSETRVTDAGMAQLKGHQWIGWLRLRKTDIGDGGVRHLASLRRLREVDLRGCARVTDAGVKALAALPELNALDLSGTRVAEDALAGLKAALPRVTISFNPVAEPGK